MDISILRKFIAALLLSAALGLAVSCGEEDDDDDYGNGGILPTPPTVTCDYNCAVPGACGEHGGVDCSAGPDIDGSVICMDGYRGSSIKYNCY